MSSSARPSADAVRLGTKAVLVVGLFVALRVVVTVLPGLDRTVLVQGLTIRDLVTATLTLGVAAAVAYAGVRIEAKLAPGVDDVRAELANGLKFFVLFVALLLAHDALGPVAAPFLTPTPGTWPFDLLFLALSLVALAVAVYRVGTNIDETADLVENRLLGSSSTGVGGSGAGTGRGSGGSGSGGGTGGASGGGSGGTSRATCPDCGTSIDRDAAFCPDCGTDLRGA
jgi:uncharacterized membrane protein YgcG